MPQVGPLEIMVVLVIALIVFGPEKLPEMARTVGRTLAELRKQATDLRTEFESSLEEVEDEPEVPEPAKEKPLDPDVDER